MGVVGASRQMENEKRTVQKAIVGYMLECSTWADLVEAAHALLHADLIMKPVLDESRREEMNGAFRSIG